MLTNKDVVRLNELYEKATNLYLDKTDFNPSDWLIDEGEDEEYASLVRKDYDEKESN